MRRLASSAAPERGACLGKPCFSVGETFEQRWPKFEASGVLLCAKGVSCKTRCVTCSIMCKLKCFRLQKGIIFINACNKRPLHAYRTTTNRPSLIRLFGSSRRARTSIELGGALSRMCWIAVGAVTNERDDRLVRYRAGTRNVSTGTQRCVAEP